MTAKKTPPKPHPKARIDPHAPTTYEPPQDDIELESAPLVLAVGTLAVVAIAVIVVAATWLVWLVC